ncbi:DNA ligase D [Acetobacteraceae bacterium H6797]|nr:DNA ligase D [Acetobacteraceae bacterium H6797]
MLSPALDTYRRRRDFNRTPEPQTGRRKRRMPIFVVQKHHARRLHWDFRLEHDGVLWSWAVPKGPSLDPADKRLAVHVEDHPLDYAGFEGEIPAGNYGAGTVEIWDEGQWEPLGDPSEGMRRGEIKFTLSGKRLNGGFVMVRLKPRQGEKGENWLLIKEKDEAVMAGGDAERLEVLQPSDRKAVKKPVVKAKATPKAEAKTSPATKSRMAKPRSWPEGAVKTTFPRDPRPQLATLSEAIPEGEIWLSEVKFDGYRILVKVSGGKVTLLTRQAQDWTHRFRSLADLIEKQKLPDALLDAELVQLRPDGISDFSLLQQALSGGDTRRLSLYFFDLLWVDGYDLRPCRLIDRKAALEGLLRWNDRLRYSDHHQGEAGAMRRNACKLGLEGIICKNADAPYRAGRNKAWLKVKCSGREEFIVLGWTQPSGSRESFGALHLGFHDEEGQLHYVGGVGTGFSRTELTRLRKLLDQAETESPPSFLYAGEKPETGIHWVSPRLVVEVQYLGWSGAGRLRHAVYLGLREDKSEAEVVRPVPDAEQARASFRPRRSLPAIITAKAPSAAAKPKLKRSVQRMEGPEEIKGIRVTHPEREIWPGLTKKDLAHYWIEVAPRALAEIANRPLALVRAPEGIDGDRFFQKHPTPGQPPALRGGTSKGDPYLVLEDVSGLVACAQISAVELHGWGATLDDPDHADRLVFDLDPDESLDFPDVVEAALFLRDRLKAQGLQSFCRTTGGKGLHLVVPLAPEHDWEAVRSFSRAFAEDLAREQPDRFVAKVSKAARKGRILIDWLRNGRGSTAVLSYSPRARPGATVATPLAWREVTAKLDPKAFTIETIPGRLARQKSDPWKGLDTLAQRLPRAGRSMKGS